jgi:hypothetical protein
MIARHNYTNNGIHWHVVNNNLGIFLYTYLIHANARIGNALRLITIYDLSYAYHYYFILWLTPVMSR